MEMNGTRLIGNVGACERILGTPIPVGFTIHTLRYLLVWLFLLPFAMQKELGFGACLSSVILGFALLGIEDVGIMLEEVFAVLPLEAMAMKIAKEGRALISANKAEMILAMNESTSM